MQIASTEDRATATSPFGELPLKRGILAGIQNDLLAPEVIAGGRRRATRLARMNRAPEYGIKAIAKLRTEIEPYRRHSKRSAASVAGNRRATEGVRTGMERLEATNARPARNSVEHMIPRLGDEYRVLIADLAQGLTEISVPRARAELRRLIGSIRVDATEDGFCSEAALLKAAGGGHQVGLWVMSPTKTRATSPGKRRQRACLAPQGARQRPVAITPTCWRNARTLRERSRHRHRPCLVFAPLGLGAPSGAASFQTASQISAPSVLAQRRASGLLLVLFAVSGCAALIYQVVWFQLLSFAIGASALSLGVLLPTYLGGLCIGSLLLPRYVSRKAHPLRVFGALELAIGALGVAALYLIPALGGIYSAWVGTGAAGLALRLLVAALALLPATILMGATLPAVAPWTEAGGDGAARLGRLYAANVAGAVAGCVLAGFYLLRVHDAYVATYVAVALDIGVGLASFALAAMSTSPQAATSASTATMSAPAAALPAATSTVTHAEPTTSRVWPILVAAALSGMTALSAEILWTRNLSLLFGGTVYAFALILAVFLLGLGAGSAAGVALGRRIDARRALAWCQLALCAAIAWGAFAIARALPYWPLDVTLPSTAALTLELDLLRTALAIMPAALLWGASFPLALAASTSVRATGERDSRRTVSSLYAANTAGTIVGALATSFVLVPALGSALTQQLSDPHRFGRSDPARRHRSARRLRTERRPASASHGSMHESWGYAQSRSPPRSCSPGQSLRCRPRSSLTDGSCRRAVKTRTSFTSARASPRRSQSRASRAGSSRITTPARRRLRRTRKTCACSACSAISRHSYLSDRARSS